MAAALSPSRASDFMQCPLLYRFRVVDRLPERPSPAALRGTLVHAVLESLFDLPAEQRTQQAALELLRPQWERVLAERPEAAQLFGAGALGGDRFDGGVSGVVGGNAGGTGGGEAGKLEAGEPGAERPGAGDPGAERPGAETDLDGWLASASELIGRWFALEDPTRLEPADRELYVETTLDDGLVLRGYVDRLDVAADGRLRVVDYKTGKAPSEAFEAKALFQMKFYALVLWRTRGRLPTMLQLVYLGNGEVLRYEPDEQELLGVERKVRALWDAIVLAAETGDWRPSPSRLCTWCDHHALCPAKGGTPPPIPEDALERVLGLKPATTDAMSRDGAIA
ncbi:RecB family exonuclease [Kineosporia babensis]|uniref:PD-(D/E)XK nuclease family protein n=1 Tax=Kineosporia babensis TaxID=499548 RepID=A0A9X1STS0_9ACTN|nr:PD-(D/E)XK nuclease family protein [Kineosporia babensis]MCD5312147.1 PD-(D/E)XK nuclease family protein [Kineosporia babensis]